MASTKTVAGGHPDGWNYAAALAGIVNSTASVVVQAAPGAGFRHYVTSLQLTAEALGAATTFVVTSGAALWRIKIGTAGMPNGLSVTFDPPLAGTANTSITIKTEVASVTGAVHANVQGFVAP